MQRFKYIFLCLPILAITLFSCSAQRKAVVQGLEKKGALSATDIKSIPTSVAIDTFKAEKNQVGDAFPEMKIQTWDNKFITTDGLMKGTPILFVLFNPGCGHCKDIINAVKGNLGMIKGANIIFLAGKPLQGQLPKFTVEMKLDKTEEIVIAGDQSDVINKVFEYNGIPQIMIYNKDHKLEHIYYSEASMLDIQNKMYGR